MENCSSSTPTSSSSAASSSSLSGSGSSSDAKTTLRALLDDEKFTMNPLPNPSVDCKENREEWERILNEVNIEQLSNNDYLYGACNCSHISGGLLLEEKGLHEEALLVWIECCNSHHAYGQYKIALRHFHGWFLYLDLFRAKELLFASANKGLIHSTCFLVRYPLPLKASDRKAHFESRLREDWDPDADDIRYEGTPTDSIRRPIESLEAQKRRCKLLCKPMTEDEYVKMTTPNSNSPSLALVVLIYLKLSKIDTTILHFYDCYSEYPNLLLEGTQPDFDSLHLFTEFFHYPCAQPFHQVIREEIQKSKNHAVGKNKPLHTELRLEVSDFQQALADFEQLRVSSCLYLKFLSSKGHMAGLNSLLSAYQTGRLKKPPSVLRLTIDEHCSLLIRCAESSVLSQEKLGYYYLTIGSGLEFDFERAKFYSKVAAEGGAVTAEENYIGMHAIDFPHAYYGNGLYIALPSISKEGKIIVDKCDCCRTYRWRISIYNGRHLPKNNEE